MSREIEYNGDTYASLTELCRELKVPYGRVYAAVKRGKSVEEAIESSLHLDDKKRTYTYGGKTYDSLGKLARDNGLTTGVLYGRLHNGYTIEEAVEGKLRSKDTKYQVEYDGKTYANLNEMCRALGLSTSLVKSRMNSGYTLKDAVEGNLKSDRFKVEYDGTEYASMAELTRELNLDYGMIMNRLRIGYTLQEAIEGREHVSGREVTYKGVTYRSLKELSEKLGIKYTTLTGRLFVNHTLEDAVEGNLRRTKKSITYEGVEYDSLSDLARAYGMETAVLRSRLNTGYSTEDAIKGNLRGKGQKVIYEGRAYVSLRSLARAYDVDYTWFIYRVRKNIPIEKILARKTLVKPEEGYVVSDSIDDDNMNRENNTDRENNMDREDKVNREGSDGSDV